MVELEKNVCLILTLVVTSRKRMETAVQTNIELIELPECIIPLIEMQIAFEGKCVEMQKSHLPIGRI